MLSYKKCFVVLLLSWSFIASATLYRQREDGSFSLYSGRDAYDSDFIMPNIMSAFVSSDSCAVRVADLVREGVPSSANLRTDVLGSPGQMHFTLSKESLPADGYWQIIAPGMFPYIGHGFKVPISVYGILCYIEKARRFESKNICIAVLNLSDFTTSVITSINDFANVTHLPNSPFTIYVVDNLRGAGDAETRALHLANLQAYHDALGRKIQFVAWCDGVTAGDYEVACAERILRDAALTSDIKPSGGALKYLNKRQVYGSESRHFRKK